MAFQKKQITKFAMLSAGAVLLASCGTTTKPNPDISATLGVKVQADIGVNEKTKKFIDRKIDRIDLEVDDAIYQLDGTTKGAIAAIKDLQHDLPRRVRRLIRDDMAYLTSIAVAQASNELKCNVDYVDQKIRNHLRGLKNYFRFWDPDVLQLKPVVCSTIPSDHYNLDADPASRLSITFNGYDMQSGSPQLLALRRTALENGEYLDSEEVIPTANWEIRSNYQITLRTDRLPSGYRVPRDTISILLTDQNCDKDRFSDDFDEQFKLCRYSIPVVAPDIPYCETSTTLIPAINDLMLNSMFVARHDPEFGGNAVTATLSDIKLEVGTKQQNGRQRDNVVLKLRATFSERVDDYPTIITDLHEVELYVAPEGSKIASIDSATTANIPELVLTGVNNWVARNYGPTNIFGRIRYLGDTDTKEDDINGSQIRVFLNPIQITLNAVSECRPRE